MMSANSTDKHVKKLGRPSTRLLCIICKAKHVSNWKPEYVQEQMCNRCYQEKFARAPPSSSGNASRRKKKQHEELAFPPSPPALTLDIVPGTVPTSTPEFDLYSELSNSSTTQLMKDLDTAANDAVAAAAAAPLSAWQPMPNANDIIEEIATSDVLLKPGEQPQPAEATYYRFDHNVKRKNGRKGAMVECVARIKKAKYGGEGNDAQKQSLRENAVDRLANYIMGYRFTPAEKKAKSISGWTWIEEHYLVVCQRSFRMARRARVMENMCKLMCTAVQKPTTAMWKRRETMVADVVKANADFAQAIDMTKPSEHKTWENPEYFDQADFCKKDGRVSRNNNRDEQQLNSRLVLSSTTSNLAFRKVLEEQDYTTEQRSLTCYNYVQHFRCSNNESDTLASEPYKPDAVNGLFVNPITTQGKSEYSTTWGEALAQHVQPLTAAHVSKKQHNHDTRIPWLYQYPMYETLGLTRPEAALRAPLHMMAEKNTFQVSSKELDVKKYKKILDVIREATHATFSKRRVAHYGQLQLFKIKTVRSKEVFFELESLEQKASIQTLCNEPRNVCVTFYKKPTLDVPANNVWFWKGASALAALTKKSKASSA